MKWYKYVLSKYATFTGRASRKEYWMFVLFQFIMSFVIGIVAYLANFQYLPEIYMLATLLPSLAVSVRRLHDTNRSGWLLFLSLIPIVCLVLLYFYCLPGTENENQYGEVPRYDDMIDNLV